MKVKVFPGGITPVRKHENDAGLDLALPADLIIGPRSRAFVNTCVAVELPQGTAGIIKSRSSLNKAGVQCEGGVIDEGYRGTIGLILYNHNDYPFKFRRGDRVAQLLVMPVMYTEVIKVSDLSETERGDGGFGSTGR